MFRNKIRINPHAAPNPGVSGNPLNQHTCTIMGE
jgi:hypothetical protein